jgi:hypothetical protein
LRAGGRSEGPHRARAAIVTGTRGIRVHLAGFGVPLDWNPGNGISEVVGYADYKRVGKLAACRRRLLVAVSHCYPRCGGRCHGSGEPRFERVAIAFHEREHGLRSARFANYPEGARSSVCPGSGCHGRHCRTGHLGFEHELDRLAGEWLTAGIEDADLERVLQGRSRKTGLLIATSDPELCGCAVTW